MSAEPDCHACADRLQWKERMFVGMILCPDCGNKRCPKASDHQLGCTRSNEPGQPGSIYPIFSAGVSGREHTE